LTDNRDYLDRTRSYAQKVSGDSPEGGDIPQPRSWAKDDPGKLAFADLPWPVQRTIEARETDRDKIVRHAQNEAADLRKQLKRAINVETSTNAAA
jgi:hypothetical protein